MLALQRGAIMVLTLKEDAQGKFYSFDDQELAIALSAKSAIGKKHNHPEDVQSVLITTIQGMKAAENVSLEEIGL